MRSGFQVRLLFFVSVTSVATASAVSACSDEKAAPNAVDAGSPNRPRKDGGGDPVENEDDDAGTTDATVKDARSDARALNDAGGKPGTECSFNRECQDALRCECSGFVCTCQPGARGTGKMGVDTCDSGEQCASSVCVDGPVKDESICTDECVDAKECGGKLPRCLKIDLFPTPICVREPPPK